MYEAYNLQDEEEMAAWQGSEKRFSLFATSLARFGTCPYAPRLFPWIIIYHPSWNTDLGVYEINKIMSVQNSSKKSQWK